MSTQTLAALRQLKLGGMAMALQTQLEQVGTYEELALAGAAKPIWRAPWATMRACMATAFATTACHGC